MALCYEKVPMEANYYGRVTDFAIFVPNSFESGYGIFASKSREEAVFGARPSLQPQRVFRRDAAGD